jgi:hypothetical protein
MRRRAQRQVPSYRPLLLSTALSCFPTPSIPRHTPNPPTSPTRLVLDSRGYNSAPRRLPCQVESDTSCPTLLKRRWTLRWDPLVGKMTLSIGLAKMSYACYLSFNLPCLLYSTFPSLNGKRHRLVALAPFVAPRNTSLTSSPSGPPFYDVTRTVAGRTFVDNPPNSYSKS